MNSSFWTIVSSGALLWRSVKIAAIVGTMYNAINQGDLVLAGKFEEVNLIKIGLTYITPFFVATYSAAITKLGQQQDQQVSK